MYQKEFSLRMRVQKRNLIQNESLYKSGSSVDREFVYISVGHCLSGFESCRCHFVSVSKTLLFPRTAIR